MQTKYYYLWFSSKMLLYGIIETNQDISTYDDSYGFKVIKSLQKGISETITPFRASYKENFFPVTKLMKLFYLEEKP